MSINLNLNGPVSQSGNATDPVNNPAVVDPVDPITAVFLGNVPVPVVNGVVDFTGVDLRGVDFRGAQLDNLENVEAELNLESGRSAGQQSILPDR